MSRLVVVLLFSIWRGSVSFGSVLIGVAATLISSSFSFLFDPC